MAINRVLYSSQLVTVTTASGGPKTWVLPFQTASVDTTIPTEDVLVLGKLGGVGREQKDVATCKASLKAFICENITLAAPVVGSGNPTYTAAALGNIHTFLLALKADSLAGTAISVTCGYDHTPNPSEPAGGENVGGFIFAGACSNISIDAAKGAFPTLDLSFDGVGEVSYMALGGSSAGREEHAGHNYIELANPVTSDQVSVVNASATTDSLNSAKFAFDMPTETVSRLGGIIKGNTTTVIGDNVMFSKPPFKSTLTVEGISMTTLGTTVPTSLAITSLNPAVGNAAATVKASFNATISSAAAVTARSQNNNVGDVGATFSMTVEGTDATFTGTLAP